ncbi:MAG: GGDEF domain-containing protein [Myxococcota bacterium]
MSPECKFPAGIDYSLSIVASGHTIGAMEKNALDVLAKLTADLLERTDLEPALQRILSVGVNLTNADCAIAQIYDAEGALTDYVHGRQLKGDDSAEISSRLAIGSAYRGTLTLRRRVPFCEPDKAQCVGDTLANLAAQILRISEYETLTLTDPETQAYNRRHLLPRLKLEMSRARRNANPLSVLLMDLDHFKRVNDQFGHSTGDAVLRCFVDIVRQHVRTTDVLVRRGGEEFVLLMPAADAAQAHAVGERIRLALTREPLKITRKDAIDQTVSIGIASWNGSESAETLEHRADLAMYEAKRGGRNRVVFLAEPLHDVALKPLRQTRLEATTAACG